MKKIYLFTTIVIISILLMFLRSLSGDARMEKVFSSQESYIFIGASAYFVPDNKIMLKNADELFLYDIDKNNFETISSMEQKDDILQTDFESTDYSKIKLTQLKNKDEFLRTGGTFHVREPEFKIHGVTQVKIFNPLTKTLTDAGVLNHPRVGHSTVLLNDGSVLIFGGDTPENWNEPIAMAEVWDPITKKINDAANMIYPRWGNASTLVLPDSRVLIAGGYFYDRGAFRTIEIYNPKTKTFSVAGKIANEGSRGEFHIEGMFLLDNGKVLIMGRNNESDYTQTTSFVEIFDINSGKSEEISIKNLKFGQGAKVLALGNNKFFIWGINTVGKKPSYYSILNMNTKKVKTVNISGTALMETLIRLPDGKILIFCNDYSSISLDKNILAVYYMAFTRKRSVVYSIKP